MELTQVGQNIPVEELTEMVQCEDSTTTTDNLSFKDAFTHFRKCLGSNQEFSWKGQLYLTLLAEEVNNVEVQIADTTTVVKGNESDTEVVTH